jgi:hypothetical protein
MLKLGALGGFRLNFPLIDTCGKANLGRDQEKFIAERMELTALLTVLTALENVLEILLEMEPVELLTVLTIEPNWLTTVPDIAVILFCTTFSIVV